MNNYVRIEVMGMVGEGVAEMLTIRLKKAIEKGDFGSIHNTHIDAMWWLEVLGDKMSRETRRTLLRLMHDALVAEYELLYG